TLVDLLYEAYRKFGIHYEAQKNITLPEGQETKNTITRLMRTFRKSPPSHIEGLEVLYIEDYLTSQRTYPSSKKQEPLSLPESDVLLFRLEDDSKYIIRPSGTEPKIKIYGMLSSNHFKDIQEGLKECKKMVEKRLHTIETLLLSYGS